MRPSPCARSLFICLSLLAAMPATAAAATLASPTMSGGAVGSAGGSFRLAGTVGEAGVVGQTAGGSYVLTEGFWRPGLGYVSAVGPDPQDPAADGATFANALAPNHPNPFSGGTTLAFSVARNSEVSLDIFDLAGRRVRRLLATTLPAGRHTMHWDGRDDRGAPVASGLYHARMNINDWSATKRMLMVR